MSGVEPRSITSHLRARQTPDHCAITPDSLSYVLEKGSLCLVFPQSPFPVGVLLRHSVGAVGHIFRTTLWALILLQPVVISSTNPHQKPEEEVVTPASQVEPADSFGLLFGSHI